MAPNKKLGKGLSSLLGNKSDLNFDKKSEKGLLLIPIENIFRDENQPRKEFDKEKIEELAKIVGKSRSHITNLLRILSLDSHFFDLLNKGVLSMGHARALVGKKPEDLDEKILKQINAGKISVRDIEKNKSQKNLLEPNIIQEETHLSQTIGFKTKITYSKNGKGNIKISFNNLEQYNFLINKLKN